MLPHAAPPGVHGGEVRAGDGFQPWGRSFLECTVGGLAVLADHACTNRRWVQAIKYSTGPRSKWLQSGRLCLLGVPDHVLC